jgi:hypothetical protein
LIKSTFFAGQINNLKKIKMKNLIKLAMVVAVMTVTMVSCKNQAGKELIKKWRVTDMNMPSLDKMMMEQKAALDTMKNDSVKTMMLAQMDQMDKEMKDNMKKMTMEFKADGTYETAGGPGADNGKWSVTDDKKKLITTSDKSKSDTIDIEELNADKLTLKMTQGPDVMSITMSPDAPAAK